MNIKKLITIVIMSVLAMCASAEPTVTDVVAKQRFPWNGLVDITCTVSGINGTTNGLKFAVDAMMPGSGDVRKISQFWVVKDDVNSTDKKVQTNGTYKLLWDAQANLGAVVYSNMVMRVAVVDIHEKIQLWEGGPYWADTNIGAEEPEDYGYYFWWGDTVGYTRSGGIWTDDYYYSDVTWVSSTGEQMSSSPFVQSSCPTERKDYSSLLAAGYIDSTGNLVPEHDAAHVHWGGDWRMPTSDELQALVNNCTTTWITTNGVSGLLVTGKGAYANRSIFLPAVGYGQGSRFVFSAGRSCFYWSSTPGGSSGASCLGFNNSGKVSRYGNSRSNAQSVRPVRGFSEATFEDAGISGTAGDSASFRLDTMEGARIARETEPIVWSGLWAADENADVSVTVNGAPFVSGKGEGVAEWTPPPVAGTYTFQHVTAGSDEVLTATFNVPAKEDIALAQVVVDCNDVTYSGSAYTPAIQSVQFGERSLAEGTDYTLAYSGNVNVGTATITLTGTNLFNGTYTTNFTIKPKSVTAAMVGAVDNVIYSGSAFRSEPTVTDPERGVTLVKGTDYTLSYTNNVNAGTAAVIVSGKGNYTGLIPKTFTISKATYDMSGARWDYTGAFTCDGNPKTVLVSGLPTGVTVTSYTGNTAIDIGNYVAHVVLAYDTTNYNAPTMSDLKWSIKSAAVTAFEGVGISEQVADGWNVTLTNNAEAVRIPDNLGKVTLDLNGFNITGTNGHSNVAGGNAIEIYASTLTGNATQLKIEDSRPDEGVDIIGGAGASHLCGGTGVRVREDARSGVSVSVGANVSISGGYCSGTGVSAVVLVNEGTITGGGGIYGYYEGYYWSPRVSGADGGTGVDGEVVLNNGLVLGGDGGQGRGLYDDDYNGNPGGSGGFAIVGNVATNSGVIKGGTGGLGGGSDWGGLGCGGSGGTAVNGSVGTNFGEVCGGRPGAYDPENIGGYGETGSGNGGDAVNGDVYANYGVIVGGTLFESTLPPDEAWDVRGSGGNGVTGNVVTNAGIICGATDGGGSGTAVKGTVGGNSGFIHNGTVFSPPDIYKVYNGSEQSVTIMPPAPYSLVECESGVDVGEYSLTLKLCGPQYLWGDIGRDGVSRDCLVAEWHIVAASVKSGMSVSDIGEYVFTGSEIKPEPQVRDISRNVVLRLGVDYELSYVNNINVGGATSTVIGKGNYTDSISKTFSITPLDISPNAVVTLGGGLIYNGQEQAQSVAGVNVGGVSATYMVSDNKATDPGTYTLTVTGTGNFTGTANKEFSIARKSIAGATVTLGGGLTYTGAAQSQGVSAVTIDGLHATFDVSGNSATAVGNYTLTVTGTGKFTGSTTKQFTVSPKALTAAMVGTVGNVTYTGSAHRPEPTVTDAARGVVLVKGTDYTLSYSDNLNAGTATVTVSGKGNYAGSIPKNFSIVKQAVTPPVIPSKLYNGEPQTADVPESGKYRVVQNIPQTNPGNYPVLLELIDGANHCWPETDSTFYTVTFTIRSGNEQTVQDVFEDLPVTIEPDGDGGWTVTLTNDIDSADLPLEIPDNVGHLTLDLNGHDLVGADGQDAPVTGETPVVPGGDGKPAIVIVPGTGDGEATRLSLVTTGGDSLVKGGDGGDGNPGGNGAPAVDVADGAKPGVKVDVGAGVTVRGGDGGSSTTGRGGDGGAGIDGNVGTNDGTIVGGNGGDSVSGDGGDGGPGVDGNVDVNNGSITGGNGGASETGDGGDGGMGVTGDVGTNNGTISGGAGGVSAQGEDGDDGIAVGGTIGGGTGTVRKVKVPVPEVPSAAYTGEALAPAVPVSGLYAVSASGGTRPGSYPVMLTLLDAANYEWEPRDGATVNGALAVVNFVIVEPPPSIEAAADDVAATYDGRGYGISVSVAWPPSGATVRYARSASGPFADEKPLFTNATDAAETWYEVSAPGFDPVTNVARVTVAPRSLANAALGSLRFEDVGGVRTPVPSLVDDLGHGVPSADYAFVWNEEANGAMTLSFTGRGNYLGTFTARLAQTRFHVTFDANGGELDAEGADYDIGTYYGVLPVPFRAGYLFDGWYESPDFSGEPVTRNTEVIAQDLTLHAKWLRRKLWYADATFHLEGAAQYNGYLVNSAAGDVVVGTIQVKAGKPSKKTGASKLTVTVQIAGEKKATLKVTTFDGAVTGTVGGRPLDLALGFSAMSGTLGPYAIDGSRDVFTAKDADSKLVAAQALKRWQGVYTVAWKGAAGWNGLSIDVKAKGKAKVAGTLADGTKVSAKSLLLVGERECALAVSWTKKASSVACLVWFREDGTVECGNLPGGASALIANLRARATLAAGSAFRIDPVAMAAAVPGLQADLLPDGLEVRMKGTSFEVDKPGKVKLLQDKSGVDLSKAGTNPSGFKLKYTVKNGTFKGAFSAYALSGGKLTKVKVSVSGVVLGGRGYGTASARKVGSWPATIE